MKKFKSIICALVVLLMGCFAFAGCDFGGNNNSNNTTTLSSITIAEAKTMVDNARLGDSASVEKTKIYDGWSGTEINYYTEMGSFSNGVTKNNLNMGLTNESYYLAMSVKDDETIKFAGEIYSPYKNAVYGYNEETQEIKVSNEDPEEISQDQAWFTIADNLLDEDFYKIFDSVVKRTTGNVTDLEFVINIKEFYRVSNRIFSNGNDELTDDEVDSIYASIVPYINQWDHSLVISIKNNTIIGFNLKFGGKMISNQEEGVVKTNLSIKQITNVAVPQWYLDSEYAPAA